MAILFRSILLRLNFAFNRYAIMLPKMAWADAADLSWNMVILWSVLLVAILGNHNIPNGKELFYGSGADCIDLQSMLWFVCNSADRLLLAILVYRYSRSILSIGLIILASEKLYNEFGSPCSLQISEISMWFIATGICMYLWCKKNLPDDSETKTNSK